MSILLTDFYLAAAGHYENISNKTVLTEIPWRGWTFGRGQKQGACSMPEVLVSHHGEERLLLDCPSHTDFWVVVFPLHFSKTTMNSCVCGTQPEATRTFLVQGEIERPGTESSSLHLSTNCLDCINS